MIKKWPIKVLSIGLLVILLLSCSSGIFSLSINNQEEFFAFAEEKNGEKKPIVSEPEKNNEDKQIISEPGKNDEDKPVVSEPEKNDENKLVVSEPQKSDEEVTNTEITVAEAVEVIRNAYLKSIYIFNRDVDPSQSIEEGIYCRPLDKQLSEDDVLYTLKGYYTKSFIERGNIATKALKVHEGNLYVLLLQGQYDYNSSFQVVSISSTEDTAELIVKLITEYDILESKVILKKEDSIWKVESGVIFPQLP